jgi:hypothetical protein
MFFLLHVAVVLEPALEPLNLKIDDADLICVFKHSIYESTRYIKKIHSVVQIGYGYPPGNCCPHNSCLTASPRVVFCLLPLSLCLFRRRHGTTVSVVTSSPPAVEHRESVLQLPSSCLQAAAPSSFSCRCRYWTAWGGDRFRFASISSFSW